MAKYEVNFTYCHYDTRLVEADNEDDAADQILQENWMEEDVTIHDVYRVDE